MAEHRDLLLEIGTEELPPKALHRLSEALAAGIQEGLEKAHLSHGEVRDFCTPRRLAVRVSGLANRQPDRVSERRGPALKAAFDEEGNPTRAAEGFARACGVPSVNNLETLKTDSGAWLVFRQQVAGKAARDLLPGIVETALAHLPIPKRMRWGDLNVEFVRPVHWLVFLLGEELISCEILGARAERTTFGHRFHHPGAIEIQTPADYPRCLESEGRVIANFAQRRERVRSAVVEAAQAAGGRAVIDEALLDEVTALVEWPVAIAGGFEERFLAVPHEALISAMKGHQKYFHVVDEHDRLLPLFVTVSNIASRQPEAIRQGNERVIRPRLADAAFFWTQDCKQRLDQRIESLKTVVFQDKLGTLYDKAERVAALAAVIAKHIDTDPELARRAARLAKCDLMTEMVGEFPELQGIMGRYYARHDGEPEELAEALDEQYLPRFSGDRLPHTKTGQAIGLADKLDTLVGIFGIGQKPTGDKDPFALRRAALGALRLIIENGLELDLSALLREAAAPLEGRLSQPKAPLEVYEFMLERLRGYYLEQGLRPDVFESVAALRPSNPSDFDRRLRAVTTFREAPEAESLAAANKRIRNILKQAKETLPERVDETLFSEDAEGVLRVRLTVLAREVQPLLDKGDYTEALKRLAALRKPVDAFFDQVLVMTEDPKVRGNRLALLSALSDLFLQVADLSRLQS